MLDRSILQTSELSKTLKHFLLTLATYADNQSGVCYPSQATIARTMSMSRRQVQRTVKEALEYGLIEVRRRWRKSNVYRIIPWRKPKLSTMATSTAQENSSLESKNVNGGYSQDKTPRKPQAEITALLEDMSQILGEKTAHKNQGWLKTIAYRCSWETVQEALSRLKQAILEGELTGNPVRSPGGLLTYLLREGGAPI